MQRAACGGLAILSSDYPEQLVEKIMKVGPGSDHLLTCKSLSGLPTPSIHPVLYVSDEYKSYES